MFFDAVEGGEEGGDGFLVCFLRGGETGFVDTVIDVVVGPFICGFYLGLQFGGEEFEAFVLRFEEVIELPISRQHSFFLASSNLPLRSVERGQTSV